MKKLVFRLLLLCFLMAGVANGATLFAQDNDAVTDSVSIDDMAPVLYDDEAYEEVEESSNGLMIAVVIVVAVVAGIAYVVVSKKKKK